MGKWLLNAIGAVVSGGVVYLVCTWLFHMRKAQAQRVWMYVTGIILVLEILGALFARYGGRGQGRRPRRG